MPSSEWTVEDHLGDKPPAVVALYQRSVELVQACGPFEYTVSKTAIGFKGSRRGFAGAKPTAQSLDGYLDLQRRVTDLRIRSAAPYTKRLVVHQFRISGPEQSWPSRCDAAGAAAACGSGKGVLPAAEFGHELPCRHQLGSHPGGVATRRDFVVRRATHPPIDEGLAGHRQGQRGPLSGRQWPVQAVGWRPPGGPDSEPVLSRSGARACHRARTRHVGTVVGRRSCGNRAVVWQGHRRRPVVAAATTLERHLVYRQSSALGFDALDRTRCHYWRRR